MAERPSGWRHLAEQNRALLTQALEKLATVEADNARLAAELAGARDALELVFLPSVQADGCGC